MPVAGYGFHIALLTAGYYYNLTFVQLGLIDLGTARLGMTGRSVSLVMALLALVALAVSVATGVVIDRRGWSRDLRIKLRLLVAVTSVRLVLTVLAPLLAAPAGYVVWVLACAGSIGVGMPVTFSFMADLIPIRDRGFAAAVPAGLAFFIAALYPQQWRDEQFSTVMATVMTPAVVLAVLAFRPSRLVDVLARQRARLGSGRFTRPPAPTAFTATFTLVVAAMFAAFFIDSLGFLRIIDTPAYISTSWQSPDVGVRLFIAVTHIVGAAMAGVLYTTFHWRWLLLWVYGLFGFTHLLYVFHLRTAAGAVPPLLLPGMYVLAVSFYTILNFALWPDLSTSHTIGTRCAVGAGSPAGWRRSCRHRSRWTPDAAGVSLLTHLRYVDALSGDHRLDGTSGTVIVGDARVAVPAATTVTAPLYLIAGTTRISGTVAARVTHIAGTLIIDDAADVEELRLIGGERTIDPRPTSDDGQASSRRPARATPCGPSCPCSSRSAC